MVKLSTTKRVISQFKGRNLSEVRAISALGRGDEPQIRSLLNKPHLKDNSARAQARLAKQYISLIQSPTPEQVKHIKQLTGKKIVRNPPTSGTQPNPNAQVLGNIPQSTGSQPTKTPKPKISSKPSTKKWKVHKVVRPNPPYLPVQQAIAQVRPLCFNIVNSLAKKWTYYQVIVFLIMDDGSTRVVSSHARNTSDLNGVTEAFQWIDFTPGGPTIYKGKKPAEIDRLDKVVIRFR